GEENSFLPRSRCPIACRPPNERPFPTESISDRTCGCIFQRNPAAAQVVRTGQRERHLFRRATIGGGASSGGRVFVSRRSHRRLESRRAMPDHQPKPTRPGRKGLPRHTKILFGLIFGLASGLVVYETAGAAPWVEWLVRNVAYPIGQIFLRLIFMIVV